MRNNSVQNLVKLTDVKVGDSLIADGGFTCIPEHKELLIQEDQRGLFISCIEGKHHLDGQLQGDYLLGLRKSAAKDEPLIEIGGVGAIMTTKKV